MRLSLAWRTAVGTGLALCLGAGCASPPVKPVNGPVLSQDSYGAIKAAYLAANPNARVGRVAAVLAASNRLSVTDIPLADFRKGDVLSVVDAKLNPIANGSVVEIDGDYLYVDYELAGASNRAPQAGDMAIRAEAPTR